jgi:hypothetical protein
MNPLANPGHRNHPVPSRAFPHLTMAFPLLEIDWMPSQKTSGATKETSLPYGQFDASKAWHQYPSWTDDHRYPTTN